MFEFTPTESGTYIFTTDSSRDTYGALADEDAIIIERDDDSGDSNNFLIEQYLEAGTTYYIGARLFSYGEPAEVNLVVTKVEEI